MPASGALISVSIFIASTTKITSPSATESPSDKQILKILPGNGASTGFPSPLAAGAAEIPSETAIS